MLLQPKQICWNVPSLLSGLGDETRGQWAVKSPGMLQDSLPFASTDRHSQTLAGTRLEAIGCDA